MDTKQKEYIANKKRDIKEKIDITDDNYFKGICDMWKVFKHIDKVKNGELSEDEVKKMWNMEYCDFIHCFTEKTNPLEALQKYKYIEDKYLINVGDIVKHENIDSREMISVCTKDNVVGDYTRCYLLSKDGECYSCSKSELQKTGRSIDSINMVLNDIESEDKN